MNRSDLEKMWQSRNYSIELWQDPPGQEWEDFSHETDELIYVLEGQLEVEFEGRCQELTADQQAFIPANVTHSVRNIGGSVAIWLHCHRTNS